MRSNRVLWFRLANKDAYSCLMKSKKNKPRYQIMILLQNVVYQVQKILYDCKINRLTN